MALSKVNPSLVQNFGRRNLIINGDMRVAQRGTTATLVNGSGGYKAVDRWITGEVGATDSEWTITQDTDAPVGFASSLKWDCTTADTSIAADSYLYQDTRIEGQNLQHLNYGTSSALQMTFSFWVKSNKTGTYVIWHRQADATRHWQYQYTIDTANTWEKKTYTIPADSAGTINNDTGNGFLLRFIFNSGTDFTSGGVAPTSSWTADSNPNRHVGQTVNLADSTDNYINITGCQLEVGDTATDFEHRSYGEELVACQRYYQKTATASGVVSTSAIVYLAVQLMTEMRAVPSWSLSGPMMINDVGVNATQSSANITAYNSTTSGTFANLDNFSGLTPYRGCLTRQAGGSYLVADAEL